MAAAGAEHLYTRGDAPARAAREVRAFESYDEAYQRELVHFHRCMLGAEECRTPPAQARIDQVVLTEMYRADQRAAS